MGEMHILQEKCMHPAFFSAGADPGKVWHPSPAENADKKLLGRKGANSIIAQLIFGRN
jgi:hypothetical protein